jgi:hypothetical protein
VPLVTRIRNASGNSFELKVDRTDGLSDAVPGIDVYYTVVEQGVYTAADHGVTMEAVKFTSTTTDRSGSWQGTSRSYDNSYVSPVVMGQVMSYNDPNFSVFWSRGKKASLVPSATELYVGKHVAEDANTDRADEILGYIVLEAGVGTIDGVGYVAGITEDKVQGIDNSAPQTCTYSGLSSVAGGVATQSGMDGGNGSWGLFYGPQPIDTSSLRLSVDEGQATDNERKHTSEQLAYWLFGTL